MAFVGTLSRMPGKGGWTFVTVPPEHVPPLDVQHWGRAPVMATVDGLTYRTSVWRGKSGTVMLALSAKVRRGKVDGDTVTVSLTPLVS